jgi:hypothetical protein
MAACALRCIAFSQKKLEVIARFSKKGMVHLRHEKNEPT